MSNATFEGPLGQIPAPDDKHRRLWALEPDTIPVDPTPIIIGIPWFSSFDRPVAKKSGAVTEYFIGLDPNNLGRVRGGHCVCVKPQSLTDLMLWWRWYDQGREGACVGYGTARALSLMNRYRYDAFELYKQAQRQDSWPGEDYSGTSVRAGLDVVRERGPYRWARTAYKGPLPGDGISANRWARDMNDVKAVLKSPYYDRRGVRAILNSWGTAYPHITYMPDETFERVCFREDGDVGIVTDR